MTRRWSGVWLLLVVAGLVFVLARAGRPEPPRAAVLDFVLKDANGREVNLASFKGKPLIVNFWATWCGPCKVETPYLEAFSRKYEGQGLTILGLETESEPAAILKFASDYKVTYPLLVADQRDDVKTAFGYRGILPTSVFIRADGTIAATIVGLKSEEYWDQQIKALF